MLDRTQHPSIGEEPQPGRYRPTRDHVPRAGEHPAPTPSPMSAAESRSRAYRQAMHDIERFARHGVATVLIEGESGTGKTGFAEYLHSHSPRGRGPLVHVNLAAIDLALAGSELYGHVAGAYTGASRARAGLFLQAARGTLFLDELNKAPRGVQERLLTAVEYRRIRPLGGDVDVRVDAHVIAATNVPLEALVASGELLPDLLPRLATFSVRIPPLRERRDDLPLLMERAVAAHAPRFGYTAAPTVEPLLLERLVEYEWPYNLRQLDGVVQRLLMLAEGDGALTRDLLENGLPTSLASTGGQKPRLTHNVVRACVDRHGSVSAAARALRVARSTVYTYLREGVDEAARSPTSTGGSPEVRIRPDEAPPAPT